jgi:hypothetical protein
MARCALIYDANVVYSLGTLSIEGLTYGVIDGVEFDGEKRLTNHICKVWLDTPGIGIVDAQGCEYMIFSIDEKSETIINDLYHLFALAFLHSPESAV